VHNAQKRTSTNFTDISKIKVFFFKQKNFLLEKIITFMNIFTSHFKENQGFLSVARFASAG